jgi:hypothetical protein
VFAHRRSILSLAISTGLIIAAFAAFAGDALTPPTPPLLKDAQAGSGWNSGGCPAHPYDAAFIKGPEARSPNVEGRLAQQFPPGTPEQKLVLALQRQGFELAQPCDNDDQIHRAVFRQNGGGLWWPYPMFATIAWKVDERGRIVWTKAFVAYAGL